MRVSRKGLRGCGVSLRAPSPGGPRHPQEVLQQRGPHPRGAGAESAVCCHPGVRAGPCEYAVGAGGRAMGQEDVLWGRVRRCPPPVPADGPRILPQDWPRQWKARLKRSPADLSLVTGLFSCLLRYCGAGKGSARTQGGAATSRCPPSPPSLCFQLPRAPHCPAPAQAAVRGVHAAVPGCEPEQPRGCPHSPRQPLLPLSGRGGAAACRAGGPAAPSLAQPALHVLGARARPGRAAAQPLQRAPRRRQPRRPRDGGEPPSPPGELLRGPGAVPGLTRGLALGGAPRAGGVAAGAAEGRGEGHPQRHR